MTGREMTGALTVKKVQVYELEDLLVPTTGVKENLKKELSSIFAEMQHDDALSISDEIGSNDSTNIDLAKVKKIRYKLDSKVLEIIGYTDKTERDIALSEVYSGLINVVQKRLDKSKSVDVVKKTRVKVEFSVYVEQLKQILIEENIPAKNTLTFAKQCEKLVRKITSESKLQRKILDAYWKEKFGERFDEKEIGDKAQVKMF